MRAASPDRIVYLGGDDALDQVVHEWAKTLVDGDPSDAAIWSRAAAALRDSSGAEASTFVRREHARLRLRMLEQLPREGRRATEQLADRTLVFIDDRERLDQNDLRISSCFIFGKSDVPVVKRVASRWFLSPGEAKRDTALVVEVDGLGTFRASVFENAECATTETLHWSSKRRGSPPPT